MQRDRTRGARRRAERLLGCAAIALSLLEVACSGAADESESAEAALTVPDGHEFVVSAPGNRVVLRTQADGRPFDFAPNELVGEAMLIHPIAGSADAGFYGWVRTATLTVGASEGEA